jgi:hypothetical protein
MPIAIATRPLPDEYDPYFARYISLVPPGDLVTSLDEQGDALAVLLRQIGPSGELHRYQPTKWSVREVVGHLIDTERVFAYRATQFSRGDHRALPSFEQDSWLPFGEYDARSLVTLLEEWRVVRANTSALARHMPSAALVRRGIASEMTFSVLALLCIIVGHVEHHLARLPIDYRAALATR